MESNYCLHDGINVIDANFYPLKSKLFEPFWSNGYVAGLTDMCACGHIYVNNIPMNINKLSVNGVNPLRQNNDGTWSWKAHIAVQGCCTTLSDAVAELINGYSSLLNNEYIVNIQNNQILYIKFDIKCFTFVKSITVGEKSTKIEVCAPDAKEGLEKVGPKGLIFDNYNVFPDSLGSMPSDQCGVLFWFDNEGWKLKRTESERLTVYPGMHLTGCYMSRSYTEPCHRPTQPVNALKWMTEDFASFNLWYVGDGKVGGVSRPNAQSALKSDIEKALKFIETVEKSGFSTSSLNPVSQQCFAAFKDLVTEVQDIAMTDGLYNSAYEVQIYRLSVAYGGDGSNYAKQSNIFSDGIGITKLCELLKA